MMTIAGETSAKTLSDWVDLFWDTNGFDEGMQDFFRENDVSQDDQEDYLAEMQAMLNAFVADLRARS